MNAFTTFEIGLCWGTLQGADLIELIETAGRHGFPTLSVRPHQITACLDAGTSAAQLRQHLRDAGVRVRVIDALGGGLPGMENVAALAAKRGSALPADEALCFRTAEAVECPMVNVSLFGGDPVVPELLAEALGGASRRAAARGLGLVLEFVPDTGIPDIHAARFLAETCGEPNCRILLDPWHLVRSGGSLSDVEAMPAGLIGAFQLDDRTPPAPGTPYVPMTGRDLPGEGQIPLHAITRAALANNPDLTAEIEVFSEELRLLGTDGAAARVAQAIRTWRAGL